ncbi:MAG: hypothetical protein ACHQDC_09330 [Acidimicrobiales bacterium]
MKVQTPDGGSPGRGRSILRKWGPFGAIVVVLALVGAFAAVNAGGDDSEEAGGGGSSTTAVTSSGLPDGVVTYQAAKDAGTADTIEWGERCDTSTGRLAVEVSPSPQCVAPFKGDNGGETDVGVTKDSIKVVLYVPQENDPVLQFLYRQIGLDDTPEDTWQTYLGYNRLLATYTETYGRRVELVRYNATGNIQDSVAGTADAETIARDLKPFAVIGGPVLTESFADTLASNKVMCISCAPPQLSEWYIERAGYVWDILKNSEQTGLMAAEYIGKRLAGNNAQYGGDDVNGKPRKFGYIYLSSTPAAETNREKFTTKLDEDYGVTFDEIASFADPIGVATQAREILARMKAKGITTILYSGDPLAPKALTTEATGQDYFPEWVTTGSALVDSTIFARTYDQKQWAHAFGMSNLAARVSPKVAGPAHAYEWFNGTPAPAKQAAALIPNLVVIYNGIQYAGPTLTHDSYQQAIFNYPVVEGTVLSPQVSWGDRGFFDFTDYAGIDDGTEIWWDADATGIDEINEEGTGMWAYVDGGKRYLPGDWPEGEPKLFDKSKDSVTLHTDLPDGITLPTYEPLKSVI